MGSASRGGGGLDALLWGHGKGGGGGAKMQPKTPKVQEKILESTQPNSQLHNASTNLLN